MKLEADKKIDVAKIIEGLSDYRPKRKGWTWRKISPNQKIGPFVYRDTSEGLKNSVPLPSAHYFGGIDPQCDFVITTEIASGHFEDDIRRMRMAAWHGADHIMVIRTTGQSHFDGLIEGTPEGVGGVPISRKQIRASRKALDLIEEEVGRPINFHSYVSGVAGPEMAVLFNEEGVNGAHQDPQYNVLYRNINMHRSFVDAACAKALMADAGILQIDGAHNANATAREAWKVMPELLVQHGINSAFSLAAGMAKENIALSTVPPTAPPAPKLSIDLPYAVALRDFFDGFKFRAQQNTRYMESDTAEATITHVLDTLISRLTSADIQSTITPDEGRNVPWHYNNVLGVNTARQTLMGVDGLTDMLELKGDPVLDGRVREIKERAVLFLEEIVEIGGYFAAVEGGHFVDSGNFPERVGDGIKRAADGGVAAGSIVERETDYMAPVCCHFGENHLPEELKKPCDLIDGCTLCEPGKIVYIDELDEEDNVARRLETPLKEKEAGLIRPEVEWAGDGVVCVTVMIPEAPDVGEAAALLMAVKMGLKDPEVIHRRVMHPAEGTLFEVKGRLDFAVKRADLVIPKKEVLVAEDEIREYIRKRNVSVVAATVGEDEHSVGMREIIDIKHGGIEKYGFVCHYLGTSVPVAKLIDATVETGSKIILISTIITHNDIHRVNMRRLADLAVERGLRKDLILIAGGTQVTDDTAKESGMDAGFGRGTKGHNVASLIVKRLRGEV
ncbi:MAG: cobalamin-dependent protein [Deltaproteobacteria bacterium]|uniref:Cobalamin-dependent protein n=1 Tax=Candidatus Zymogenus saltonus TaxID=2844893 RepID=A0A9D8KFU2_9DELT|nr:cobalamin-dependent protein [Candidatus Zymogenus saltonus]